MSFFFTIAYSACFFSGRLLVLFVFPSSIAASAGSMGSYWVSGWLEWLLEISKRQKIVVNKRTYVKTCDSWHWVRDLKINGAMEYTPITKKCFIYKKIFNNHVRESVVIPVAPFKKDPFNYYLYMSLISRFMMSTPPRPLRVCVLSATLVRHWTACSIVCVVDFLSMSSSILLCICISFFVVSKVLSFLLVVLLIFFFFLDRVVELALWVIQAFWRSLQINK